MQNRRKVVIYFSSGYDFNPFAHERIFARDPVMAAARAAGPDSEIAQSLPEPVTDPITG